MSISDPRVIDLVARAPGTKPVVALLISDHLPWDIALGDHVSLLLAKLETYVAYAKDGQLREDYPDDADRDVVVELVVAHELTDEADSLMHRIRSRLEDEGLGFRLTKVGEGGVLVPVAKP